MTFRVHVDLRKCQGHNRCYVIAPDLFDLNDMGVPAVAGHGAVPAELVESARRVEANCPEFAISLTEASGG